jgi:DNA-binding NtrC family response regulator
MGKILFAWLGNTDLRAVDDEKFIGIGPIAQAVVAREFDRLVLLSNHSHSDVARYLSWLTGKKSTPCTTHFYQLSSPMDFGEIYQAAVVALQSTIAEYGTGFSFTYHLSPGTSAMAAVWILLAKSLYPAELLESSLDHGVKTAHIPFDISAEFTPTALLADERFGRMLAALPPEAPEFEDILHRSPAMQRVITKARLAAVSTVPVLIEGESGTGKELLARAIHKASNRADKPFVAVNCGAIPAELVESEFFGHKRGAFTGAAADKPGYFEAANGGTLFLDEIGELPLAAQVKILRVLQEGEVLRVGDTKSSKVDVRVVAATNRSLIQEVSAGRFRADLFYRLAVAVLHIPSLRERQGDLGLLIDHFLQSDMETGTGHKKISASARNLLLNHPWPGNVRELLNTLRRAMVWSTTDTLQAEDIREALFPVEIQTTAAATERNIAEGFSIQDAMAEVAKQYLQRAMHECRGNKSKAAKMLGLPNYQTLTNWLKKYGLE